MTFYAGVTLCAEATHWYRFVEVPSIDCDETQNRFHRLISIQETGHSESPLRNYEHTFQSQVAGSALVDNPENEQWELLVCKTGSAIETNTDSDF